MHELVWLVESGHAPYGLPTNNLTFLLVPFSYKCWGGALLRRRLLLACAWVKPEPLFGKHLIVLAQYLLKFLLPLSTCHETFLDLSLEEAVLLKNRC